MGLMLGIANSRIGKVAKVAMSIEAVLIPYEMLHPQSISAQAVDYGALIEKIKGSKDTIPVKIRNADGSVQILQAHRLSGYNPELKSIVQFTFYPIEGGVLETRINNSAYVPKNIIGGEGSGSVTHALIIAEGGQNPIDGNPETVGVEQFLNVPLGTNPGSPSRVEINRTPLGAYGGDPSVTRGVNTEYFSALSKTIFPR